MTKINFSSPKYYQHLKEIYEHQKDFFEYVEKIAEKLETVEVGKITQKLLDKTFKDISKTYSTEERKKIEPKAAEFCLISLWARGEEIAYARGTYDEEAVYWMRYNADAEEKKLIKAEKKEKKKESHRIPILPLIKRKFSRGRSE